MPLAPVVYVGINIRRRDEHAVLVDDAAQLGDDLRELHRTHPSGRDHDSVAIGPMNMQRVTQACALRGALGDNLHDEGAP